MAESEIPEDIMDVAFHLTAGDWNQPHDVRAKKVAAAILAERNAQKERDAQIADGFADEKDVMALSSCSDGQVIAYREGERTANQIASIIRQRDKING
jgi:hypothetical protein